MVKYRNIPCKLAVKQGNYTLYIREQGSLETPATATQSCLLRETLNIQQKSPISAVSYEFLGDEIDDSPITNDDGVFSAIIGIAYQFGN